MVIPINPSSIPDSTGVPANKLRVDQLQKVTPVALNDQVISDPKAAVNFALAASQSDGSSTPRYTLANPGLVALSDAELAALQAGLDPNQPTKQTSQNPLSPDLAKLLITSGDSSEPASLVTAWPESAPNAASNQQQAPNENTLRQNLQTLYQNLASSPMFAAENLASLLGPRLGQGNIDDKNQELIKRVEDLMKSISEDAPDTQQAAKLLMHGIIHWQGEFLPGLKATIRREDIWEKDPKHENQMLRGSKITMEMNLPQSGLFKVVGVQFQDTINLTIEPPETFRTTYMTQRNDLELRLKEHVPLDVRYQMAKVNLPARKSQDE
jgi:hypothetical protein